jgi:hypothetical protein
VPCPLFLNGSRRHRWHGSSAPGRTGRCWRSPRTPAVDSLASDRASACPSWTAFGFSANATGMAGRNSHLPLQEHHRPATSRSEPVQSVHRSKDRMRCPQPDDKFGYGSLSSEKVTDGANMKARIVVHSCTSALLSSSILPKSDPILAHCAGDGRSKVGQEGAGGRIVHAVFAPARKLLVRTVLDVIAFRRFPAGIVVVEEDMAGIDGR